MERKTAITDILGIQVGHAQDDQALTGCTVILCPQGAVAGVDQRGGAPGTRETDLLRPGQLVEEVHAVLLAGGSAFGLDAASGVMRWLEERGFGFETAAGLVPVVPGAVLYDLAIGEARRRPDAEMGYQACQNASTEAPVEGTAGAGMGATIGKIFGPKAAMKSGIGSAGIELENGVIVAALTAVNAFGDVIQPGGEIIAGARDLADGYSLVNTLEVMKTRIGSPLLAYNIPQNTIIGVVATNADLSKEEVNRVALMAQDGVAMTVRPAHTQFDGDTLFALATGEHAVDVNIVGAFAAQVVAQAILRAVQSARSAGGLPSAADLRKLDHRKAR